MKPNEDFEKCICRRGHTVNIVNLARHFLDYFIFKNRKSMPTIDIYLLLFKQAYTVLPGIIAQFARRKRAILHSKQWMNQNIF